MPREETSPGRRPDPDLSPSDAFTRRLAEYGRIITWYHQRITRHGALTKFLRQCGIAGIGIASLWPVLQLVGGHDLIAGAISKERAAQLGYLAAALGGLALAVERYSGASSGWIRYAKAAMRLEKYRDSLKTLWNTATLRHAEDKAALRDAQCRILDQSVEDLWSVVIQETDEWATGYVSDLSALRDSNAGAAPKRDEGKVE